MLRRLLPLLIVVLACIVGKANDRLGRMVDEMTNGQTIYKHDDFGNLASAMYEDKQFDYQCADRSIRAVRWGVILSSVEAGSDSMALATVDDPNEERGKKNAEIADRVEWSTHSLPDEVGNLYRTEDKQDRKYGKGGQLQEVDGYCYSYDEEGNLISKQSAEGLWKYSWYGTGMLESVSRPDGERITFEYDALGRRTAKIADGQITRFVWDGNVPLHEWTYDKKDRPQMVLDAYGFLEKSHEEPTPEVTTWVFDEGTFKPAAKIVGGESYSIVTDYLGTPVEAYASDGEQVWTAEYDIYGKRRKGTSVPLSDLIGEKCFVPFRYQGMYEDEETGLCYNRFRYYSNTEGIYLSQDPIGLRSGEPNFYSYVHDPNTWVDVFGLSDCNVIKVKNRSEAIRKAKDHAKVPRSSKGGRDISIDELNPTSRGKNWETMKAQGGTKLGAENPNGKNKWFEHPDGHPDAGNPGAPAHHNSGHVHSTNSNGEELIFVW